MMYTVADELAYHIAISAEEACPVTETIGPALIAHVPRVMRHFWGVEADALGVYVGRDAAGRPWRLRVVAGDLSAVRSEVAQETEQARAVASEAVRRAAPDLASETALTLLYWALVERVNAAHDRGWRYDSYLRLVDRPGDEARAARDEHARLTEAVARVNDAIGVEHLGARRIADAQWDAWWPTAA